MNDNESNTPQPGMPDESPRSEGQDSTSERDVNTQNAATNGASGPQQGMSYTGAPLGGSVPPRPEVPTGWSAPAASSPTSAPRQYPSHDAFGVPQGQYQGVPPYGAQQTPPAGGPQPTPQTATATRSKPKKKTGSRMLLAGLVIGAIVGGASGAGAFAIIDGFQDGNPVANSSPNSSVTINNSKEVTATTAIAAKAAPSVVTISVRGTKAAGSGSGIIMSKDGYVLTNNHVVTLDGESAHADIQVTDDAGNIYSASVVGTDPVYDLAVIKLKDASDLTPMTFADSSNVNVGDMAVAIGAPLGLSGTVTDGIVSALNRSITVASSAVPKDSDQSEEKDAPFEFGLPDEGSKSSGGYVSLAVIQTDAAINPGNSGGALVDDQGELIGVNVAIASAGSSSEEGSQSGSIGVGFAIPSNIAKRIADEIIEDGSASHGLLGAAVTSASSDPDATVSGALVKEITPGGAADKAGLRSGDIITKYGDIPISKDSDLVAQVKASAAGSDVTITYVRDGKHYTTDVTLGELTE